MIQVILVVSPHDARSCLALGRSRQPLQVQVLFLLQQNDSPHLEDYRAFLVAGNLTAFLKKQLYFNINGSRRAVFYVKNNGSVAVRQYFFAVDGNANG
jgi:hypothetical protein